MGDGQWARRRTGGFLSKWWVEGASRLQQWNECGGEPWQVRAT